MKKILVLLLAFAMLCLAACGTQGGNDITFTVGGGSTEEAGGSQDDAEAFCFMAGDVEVIPGMEFDAEALPTEEVSEIPSCAFEGTDKVYSYGSYEIIAYNDGEKEVVYSIYFIEPDVSTPEGLANGDDMSKAKELYGEYTEDGTAWTFTRGNTQLIVIGEDDVISSIEMRLAD